MAVIRVVHLVGSPTSQAHFDLSALYAGDCLAALHQPDKYEFIIALVTPDGLWRFPASLGNSGADAAVDAAEAAAQPMAMADAIAWLAQQKIDVALPQMFCLPPKSLAPSPMRAMLPNSDCRRPWPAVAGLRLPTSSGWL